MHDSARARACWCACFSHVSHCFQQLDNYGVTEQYHKWAYIKQEISLHLQKGPYYQSSYRYGGVERGKIVH